MTQSSEKSDPFKGFPFSKETSLFQRHLYAGAKDVCSGAFVQRKAAIQLIWQRAGIIWHTWMDHALESFCSYNWVTWTGPAPEGRGFKSPATKSALMAWLYVIQNGEGRFYVGMTTDLPQRRVDHDAGVSKWTKHRGPWKLVWS